MSKALVIKGANFSANKLTTVVLEDNPCTGIALSEDSITLTDYTPVTLVATVTPADTTDSVVWSSSDTNVATVNNGVVTAAGLGSATITAVCGNYSATATVTVSIAYIPNLVGGASTTITTVVEPNIVTVGASGTRFTACGTGAQKSTFVSISNSGWTETENAIVLPKNTERVRIYRGESAGSMFDSDGNTVIWTQDVFCGNNTYPTGIKPISSETISIRPSAAQSVIVNVPEGADSMFITIHAASTPEDWATFYTNSGFGIEFLLAETT